MPGGSEVVTATAEVPAPEVKTSSAATEVATTAAKAAKAATAKATEAGAVVVQVGMVVLVVTSAADAQKEAALDEGAEVEATATATARSTDGSVTFAPPTVEV